MKPNEWSDLHYIQFAKPSASPTGQPISADKLRVKPFELDKIKKEMKYFGVSTPEELSDGYRLVFLTKAAAEDFLARYLDWYERAKDKNAFNEKYCLDRSLPSVNHTKRHILHTLMGEKFTTDRERTERRIQAKPGELFNFKTRDHFLTCRLLSITKTKDGVRYSFELP